MNREIKLLLWIYLASVVIRAVLAYFIPTLSIFSDEYVFAKVARSIFHYGEFLVHGLEPRYPPLYSLIISASYIFKDMNLAYLFMKIINAIIFSLVIFPIYFLAREFLDQKKALLITIISLILAPFLIFPGYIMAENLFFPLFLFFVYFMYRAFKENNNFYFVLAGILLGLLLDTRRLSYGLIPVVFLVFLFLKFRDKESRYKYSALLFHYIPAFLAFLPLLLANLISFGPSMFAIEGGHSEAQNFILYLTHFPSFLSFLNYFLLYASYLILASGVFFALYYLAIARIKDKNLRLLFLISNVILIILFIGLASQASSHYLDTGEQKINAPDSPFSLFTTRVIGRYLACTLPLIFILGYTSYSRRRDLPLKLVIPIALLLAFAAQLAIIPLFPLNNSSLTSLGLYQYVIEFLLYAKISYQVQFHWASFLIIAVTLFLLPFIVYKLRNNKSIVFLILLFLLTNSALAYGITYWNSSVNWMGNEQTQLGIFFHDFDKGQSKVLFDEAGCSKEDFPEVICSTKTTTVAGFWMNNYIRVDSIDKAPEFDYLISSQELNYPVIRETETGTLYKIND